MINFYRGTLGVPLVCDKRNGAKRSVKLGRFRCQRQRNGAKRTIKYKEVPLPLAAEWWGDSLKKRSRRAAASPPPACSLSSSADAPFRSLASGISIFSSFLPYTVHHSAIRVSVERNPNLPSFSPLCDAPFRSQASGISIFSSFLPYTVHHSAKTRQRRAGTLVCKTSSMWRKLNGTNSKISDFSCS